MSTAVDTSPLDDPVGAALRGPHAPLAERRGPLLRYREGYTPFGVLAGPGGVAALRPVLRPGEVVTLMDLGEAPDGWGVEFHGAGVQMVATDERPEPDPEAVPLGPADVPEIFDLVSRSRPGPFQERTVDLGGYLGIRRDGRLVAMAGERMRPDGFAEISAVCTDPDWQGRGLAGRLVRAVAAGIRGRDETPFLHASVANTGAIRLYERLGFATRRLTSFTALQLPG